MRAARLHEYGHADRIQVEDIAMPDQRADQVLVRIDAAGINPIDWKIREGARAKAIPRAFPFTLGQDFAGEVIAVGEAVTGVEASEDVYGFAPGAYAEYAAVSPDHIAAKPATIDEVTAATLPTPGLTALQAIRALDPKRGETIVIHGAAGGVGSIATQLCLARGVRVVAVAAAKDAEYLTELGVALVIDYETERFEDRVRDVEAVLDLVGGETLARSFGIVRRGGAIATTLGPIDESKAGAAGTRGIQIWMQRNSADLRELARLVDEGVVKPRAARVLPLEDARSGQDLSQFGHVSEKIVLAVH